MTSGPTDRAKMTLFSMWLRHGSVKVFFDADADGVFLEDEYRGLPDACIEISSASHNSEMVYGELRTMAGELTHFQIVWAAIHTMESPVLSEIHVWAEDYRAALERHAESSDEPANALRHLRN